MAWRRISAHLVVKLSKLQLLLLDLRKNATAQACRAGLALSWFVILQLPLPSNLRTSGGSQRSVPVVRYGTQYALLHASESLAML